MKIDNKLKFIIIFIISYLFLLVLGYQIVSPYLITLQKGWLQSIFINSDLLNNFIIVKECSGIVSMSAFLGIMISFSILKIRYNLKKGILFLISLFLINFLRVIIIVYISKYSLVLSKIAHFVFWFLIGLIIFYFSKKILKK